MYSGAVIIIKWIYVVYIYYECVNVYSGTKCRNLICSRGELKVKICIMKQIFS